ncbi:MAG: hypothetical protein ABIF85_00070 [Nanoarchaeota archaeon]|nr:hypothetical protein [Nanoarchaeota archaeon]MBU4300042.1 hypothetical protein [Nanoarchaeota archaeon]MBU4451843.1 hypothetical protein [Nanoarchaeota archaeon]MCG2724421.1 hypothetical protein [archaeon]
MFALLVNVQEITINTANIAMTGFAYITSAAMTAINIRREEKDACKK